MSWSNDMINRMNSGELAKDVPEAESLLQVNNERKVRLQILLNFTLKLKSLFI